MEEVAEAVFPVAHRFSFFMVHILNVAAIKAVFRVTLLNVSTNKQNLVSQIYNIFCSQLVLIVVYNLNTTNSDTS